MSRQEARRGERASGKEAVMATILYLGTAGSDDPTRAGLPFNFALGARDAGHEAQIFLAGEAVYLVKASVADAVMPVAMPALKTMIDDVVAQRVPIFV
jgi:predicted peroxiredoxin